MLLAAALAAAITYQGTVLKVIDGDTIKVHVAGFPAFVDPIDVRIYGLDTPEHVMPPAKAACEVALGLKAKAYAVQLVAPGKVVAIHWAGRREKYGRLLAAVTLPDGRDWAATLIAAKLGRAYGLAGDLHKASWC